MASKLVKYSRKPAVVHTKRSSFKFKSGDWKGAGLYYHRGKGKMQRFKLSRDLHKSAPTTMKKLGAKWRHIHDSKVVRVRGHKIGKV